MERDMFAYKRILYGTGNPAKLSAMKRQLEKLDVELIGLNDLKAEGVEIPNVSENGDTPLENARQKATWMKIMFMNQWDRLWKVKSLL